MCKIMNAEIKKKEAKKKMGSLMIIAYEEEVTCCWVSRNFFFISNSIMLVVNKCFSIYNVYVRLLTQVRRLGYSASCRCCHDCSPTNRSSCRNRRIHNTGRRLPAGNKREKRDSLQSQIPVDIRDCPTGRELFYKSMSPRAPRGKVGKEKMMDIIIDFAA